MNNVHFHPGLRPKRPRPPDDEEFMVCPECASEAGLFAVLAQFTSKGAAMPRTLVCGNPHCGAHFEIRGGLIE